MTIDKIRYFSNVLRNFDINHGHIYHHLTSNNYYYFYNLYNPPIKKYKKGKYKYNYQFGGKKIDFNYHGHNYIFYYHKDEHLSHYAIHVNNNENKQKCLFILVDRSIHIANINNISYYKDCGDARISERGGGTKLLKLAIKFLKKYKDKLDINRIQLKDNSHKLCKKNRTNIPLSIISILTTGDTWYGRHGFYLFDEMNLKPDKENQKWYMKNKEIMDKVKVKDTKVEKYIRKALKKENDIDMIEDLDGLFMHYNDRLLRSFMSQFIKEFDSTCILFSHFFYKLFMDLKLHNLHGASYYMSF